MVICLLVWLPWQQKTPIDIMEKWLNCIFFISNEVMGTIFGSYDYLMIVYPVCAFHDQWSFCLVSMATLNLRKKKKIFFSMTTPPKPLKQ